MISSITNLHGDKIKTYNEGINRVVLDGPANIVLSVAKKDIASAVQIGDDLVICSIRGQQILIEDYFITDSAGSSNHLIIDGIITELPLI